MGILWGIITIVGGVLALIMLLYGAVYSRSAVKSIFSQGRLTWWLILGCAVIGLLFWFWEEINTLTMGWMENTTSIGIWVLLPLTVAWALYQTGTRIKNPSPSLRVAGAIVALLALLSTGIGQWGVSVFEKIDTTASCSANPHQTACIARDLARAEKEAAERAEAAEEKAAKMNRLAAIARQQLSTSTASPIRLGSESYEIKEFGSFKQIPIAVGEKVGPINMYQDTCLYFIKTDVGSLQVLSRPDFTSEVVPAVMGENGVTVVAWGHAGKPYQLFLRADKGPIKIEMERRRGDSSCT